MRGVVKWFSDQKGYGFITPDGTPEQAEGERGKDMFVHQTKIVADGFRSLKEGAKVEFEVEKGPKGTQAVQVRTIQ